MTVSSDPAGVNAAPRRPADLALARAHLRLGSLTLARAELETLAGAGELDGPGRVDLAEARWRTGDLAGAGEAAMEALAALGDQATALVIAAEAAAALGRPNEARRLAMRALDCVDGSIDGIFAGMPRSAVWPADAAEPPPTAATLFQQDSIPAQARRAGDSEALVASTLRSPVAELPAAGTTSRTPVTPGFWDVDTAGEPAAPDLPDPAEELEAARRALVAGSLDEAALRFAVTLRLAPALAPAVLEATEGGAGPALQVVRGDAFRLVGLETEARRAYAMAAWSGARDRRGTAAAAPNPVPDVAPNPVPDAAPDPPPVSDTIPRVQRTRTQGRHARH
jgi:hypothetical protein